MNINLSSMEVEDALKEYLKARGVPPNTTFDILVKAGRKGNKATAVVGLKIETPEITKVNNLYAPSDLEDVSVQDGDYDDGEEEEEISQEESDEEGSEDDGEGNVQQPEPCSDDRKEEEAIRALEEHGECDISDELSGRPDTEEAPVSSMKSLFSR